MDVPPACMCSLRRLTSPQVRAFGCMAEELAQRAGLVGKGPVLSASTAAKLAKLIEQCMRPDVAARPSFAAIVATLADI